MYMAPPAGPRPAAGPRAARRRPCRAITSIWFITSIVRFLIKSTIEIITSIVSILRGMRKIEDTYNTSNDSNTNSNNSNSNGNGNRNTNTNSSGMGVHPVSVRRFPSFRTQPLENLLILLKKTHLSNPAPTNEKDVSEQPSPWRKPSEPESCYGDRVYVWILCRGGCSGSGVQRIGVVLHSKLVHHVI